MNNGEYWKQRQEAKYLKGERDLGEFYNGLEESFRRAKKSIHNEINNFYIRYANNNELTYDVAMEELNFDELKELKDELGEFKTLSLDSIGEFNLDLENMSMRARITRYQALEMQLDAILNNLYSIDYEAYGTDKLINIYKDQYYRTIFNIEQYKGFHSEFAQISNRAVEELINYPFSGASYSDRLWRQKDDLIFKLKDSLTNMIIKGTNPNELAEDFAKHFGTKEDEAYRLLQMENAFIVEQATLKGYEEDGIEKYEILATLDLKTSDTCRNQDGKKYDVKKALTGVNSPPFHWFCRTTTIPYIEDYEDGKRIARDPITGKNYNVPAEMKYEQWYNKYVANDPKALVEEKKIKNRYSDKKQHTLYKEVLGKEASRSFAAFQELKYNDINGWEQKKRQYGVWNQIDSDDSKSDEYKAKMKETYKYFKENGYEFTTHGINRFLGQRKSKGKRVISQEETLEILNKHKNYVQPDGNFVRFYDNIVIVTASDTNEVVSIISRPKPKTEWEEL
jgi:SPP1 gp7 family putative phage head morphogenesis protein